MQLICKSLRFEPHLALAPPKPTKIAIHHHHHHYWVKGSFNSSRPNILSLAMFPLSVRKRKSIRKTIQRSARSQIFCVAITAIVVSLVLALLLFLRFRRHELAVRHQRSVNEALRKRYIALSQTHNRLQLQRALSIVPHPPPPPPSPPLSSQTVAVKRKFIPIVVYVHNRPHYFRQIVSALRNVTGIENSLLIVSHDGIFDEMNEIVESIDFVNVIQLLHPYYNAGPEERGLSKLRRHWW